MFELIKEALSLFKDWLKYPIDRINKKKEHDRNLYLAISEIIPSDLVRDFFIVLGYNRYEKYQSRAFFDYLHFCDRVDKVFFDKKIREAKEAFDSTLNNLLEFLSTHFFVPHTSREVDYYQLYPDKDKYIDDEDAAKHFFEMFRQREEELDALADKTKDKYAFFINMVKKRLIL